MLSWLNILQEETCCAVIKMNNFLTHLTRVQDHVIMVICPKKYYITMVHIHENKNKVFESFLCADMKAVVVVTFPFICVYSYEFSKATCMYESYMYY